MNSFFNNVISDEVQITSFILEVFGLWLAYVSMRNPVRAEAIEIYIDNLESRSRIRANKLVKSAHFNYVSAIPVISFFLSIAYMWVHLVNPNDHFHLHWLVWVFVTLINILALFPVIMMALADLIHFLDRTNNGKAMEAVGFGIASIGLIGNLYQVITIAIS